MKAFQIDLAKPKSNTSLSFDLSDEDEDFFTASEGEVPNLEAQEEEDWQSPWPPSDVWFYPEEHPENWRE